MNESFIIGDGRLEIMIKLNGHHIAIIEELVRYQDPVDEKLKKHDNASRDEHFIPSYSLSEDFLSSLKNLRLKDAYSLLMYRGVFRVGYDKPTRKNFGEFYRGILAKPSTEFEVVESGQPDSICRLCCNFDEKECQLGNRIGYHPPGHTLGWHMVKPSDDRELRNRQYKLGEVRTIST